VNDRQQIEARFGSRWGRAAVLLLIPDGEPLRAPLPDEVAPAAVEGRLVSAYLNGRGGLDGWALPDDRIGVRMQAEQTPEGSSSYALDCRGRCQTLWYVVAGGKVSPGEGCLTCGGPVVASQTA